MTGPQDYIGEELGLFLHATNWKRYFAARCRPYVRGAVLDAGCGLGANAEHLWNDTVTGWTFLEPDRRLLDQVPANAPAHVVERSQRIHGTTADLPSVPAYDTILYVDVIEHIEQSRAELARAFQLLRPGGHLVILVPAFNLLYSPFDKAIGHFRRYDKAMLRAELPPGGRIARLEYLDSLAFFMSLANKWVLGQRYPTLKQVMFWDRTIVPLSRMADPMLFHTFGKSLLCACQRP